MKTTEPIQVPRSNVVGVFFLYQDFRVRVDDNSPVHFDLDVWMADAQGTRWVLSSKVYGLDRRGGLMVFEYKWAHTYL